MATDESQAASDRAARVTELLLDSVLAQPLQTLVVPELHAGLAILILRHQLRGPLPWLGAATAQAVQWLHQQGPLGGVIPPPLAELLRELLRRPYVPDRALALGLLGVPPIRTLMRELMVGTLMDYGRKLRAGAAEPVPGQPPPAKGGLLGRLATEAMRKGSAAAMAVAPGVATAVSDEFERQMQRRASEFADGAVDELLQRAATTLTDPQRRADQTALKLALLDHVLSLRGPQLAHELERLEPSAVAELVRVAALSWLQRDGAEAELAALLHKVRDQAPGKTLGTLLEEAGVLTPVRTALLQLFTQAAGPLVASGALFRALSGGAE